MIDNINHYWMRDGREADVQTSYLNPFKKGLIVSMCVHIHMNVHTFRDARQLMKGTKAAAELTQHPIRNEG